MFRQLEHKFWSPEPNAGDPTPPVAPPPAAPPADPPVAAAPPADPPAPAVDPPAAPADPPPAPPGPPEKYELTAPADSGLEPADLDALAATAKAEGWTQDQAQAYTTATAKTLAANRAALKAELDAHPDLSGANAVPAEERYLRVLDRFLPANTAEGARLRADLVKSGNQHNVPFRLLMANIGRAMGEDPGVGSVRAGGAPQRSPASVMYPGLK